MSDTSNAIETKRRQVEALALAVVKAEAGTPAGRARAEHAQAQSELEDLQKRHEEETAAETRERLAQEKADRAAAKAAQETKLELDARGYLADLESHEKAAHISRVRLNQTIDALSLGDPARASVLIMARNDLDNSTFQWKQLAR